MVAFAAQKLQVRWDMRMREGAREGGTSSRAGRERPGCTHNRQPQGRGPALMLVTQPERHRLLKGTRQRRPRANTWARK